jgi:hypothetical protein
LVTPSLGQIYAGQPFTWGQAMRVGSGVAKLVGLTVAL